MNNALAINLADSALGGALDRVYAMLAMFGQDNARVPLLSLLASHPAACFSQEPLTIAEEAINILNIVVWCADRDGRITDDRLADLYERIKP